MQDIEALCERVILIDHGCVMFDGALEGIVEQFSGSKIIDAKFSRPTEADFSRLGSVLEKTPDSVKIEVPRARVAEVCRFVLDRARWRISPWRSCLSRTSSHCLWENNPDFFKKAAMVAL